MSTNVSMSTLFVGCDLHEKTIAVCLMLPDGTEPLKRFGVEHSPAGVHRLAERILKLAQEHALTRLVVGMESTGMLWWPLQDALRRNALLTALCPEVFLLNARVVAHFKKQYSQESKSDHFDAFVIADRLRFRRPKHPVDPDEQYFPLQRLTRHRFHLVHALVREKNRFLSHLFLQFSGYVQQQQPFFTDTFGATSAALLSEWLSAEEIARQDVQELAEFLCRHANGSLPEPQTLALAIQKAARSSYHLRDNLTDCVHAILCMTLANVRFFEKQIRAVDQLIERELQAFPLRQVLLSIPGIGPVLSAGILAEVQQVERFTDDDALARFAALVWKHSGSGDFEGEETPISHTGNAYLRYYLVEAANSVRVHAEEFAAFYRAKYRQSAKHAHKRACVLTARKLVRVLFALLRKGQLYQPPAVRARKEPPADPRDAQAHEAAGEVARHIIRRRRARSLKATSPAS